MKKTTLLIALIISTVIIQHVNAQIPVENKNPAEFLNTKIYPLRDAENGVKIQKVAYQNRFQINIVANLFLPPNYDVNKKYAAIVVGPPFGGVKEQTSGLHAQKLAELGYVTLAYDPVFIGESGGYPRHIESPEMKVEDFSAAIDFLSNHVLVDKNRIGVLGVCASGGYSVAATAIDHRIKALATVSMYDMGRARRQGVGDIIPFEQRMKTLDEIGEQRTREFAGAQRKDIRALPEKVDSTTPEFAREFLDYYDTPRGNHPNSTAWYSYTSLAPMMNFFPFAQIETISPRPLLFIAGEKAVSKYFSEDAYSKAKEPKELYVVPGANHVDLYDQPQYMKYSLKKLNEFYKQYLK
ncbi:alpha/beta hydrolase [Chitinophaga sp. MM2321]|uniref:alpha/beta hydrolase n=1 Tax=Chitinophaga sp. MM2321 TaxID=3137178 RepID=UPI0032D58295